MAKNTDTTEEENVGASFEGGDGSVTVDLSNVEEAAGFELIPRGTYAALITNCEYSLSQNSGKPMWTLELTISEGDYEGRKLFTHMSFSEKALPMTKRTLAQIAPEFLSGPFSPEDEAHKMVNRAVSAKVKIEKYEGEDRSRVQRIEGPANSSGSGAFFEG